MERAALVSIVGLASLTALAANPPLAATDLRIMLFAAPNGSATNTGMTANSPWPLSYAMARAVSSSIITLLPGTYPSFEISQPGVKFVSQTKWRARVVGSPGVHGIWTDNNVGNVTIDGIEVASSALDGISLNGSNCVVRNCWVHDSSGNGVSAHAEPNTLVERNLIERNGKAPAGGQGIDISGTNCIVRGNVVRYNQGWGCQIYDPPPYSTAECNFYNNLVYGNGAGLTVWSPAGQTNYVFNNTIISPTNYCLSSDYGNLRATNNILVVGGGLPVIVVADGATVWSDYNLVNASTSPGGSHDVVAANPGFVNISAGLYWLTALSQARAAADPAVVPPVDFFGNSESSVTDVGAVQYNSALAADTRVLDPSGSNGADYWAQVSGGGTAPSITTQPQNQTVTAGQSATFTVTVVGDAPLSYQWTFNGLNVGSSSSSYTRSNCQLADAGSRAQVTVSNASGSVQSSTATLTVNPAGRNYYVSPTGSTGNTGLTTNSPWTLAKGISYLGPDVTIILMPGLYTGPVAISGITNGTPGHPATLKSQTKWAAVVANSPTDPNIWLGYPPYISYLVLDGVCVSNALATHGITWGGNHNTIRNCWVVNNYGVGILATSAICSNNVFEFNLVEHNAMISAGNPSQNQYHGMYIGGQNNVIRGNVVRWNNNGYGIQVYTGYAGEWVNNNSVYNNLTYGQTNCNGITVWGANGNDGSLPGTNFVFSNTVLDGMTVAYGTIYITNNIVLPGPKTPTTPIYQSVIRVPTVRADYNLSTYAFTTSGPHDVITNYVGFVNINSGLYWLKSDSPARGHALSTVYGPVDFFGNAQSSVMDIGALQYNATLAGDIRVLDPSPANPDYWSLP